MAKITIALKDPDGVHESIKQAAEDSVRGMGGLDASEASDLESTRQESYARKLGKWIEYGEYVRIEFDTDAGTATVLPVK